MPATKNVELYNPEMDESKPKSEVLSLKHWNLTIIPLILREDTCVWSQVDAENDKLLTDITFILTMRRKTLFYTVNITDITDIFITENFSLAMRPKTLFSFDHLISLSPKKPANQTV